MTASNSPRRAKYLRAGHRVRFDANHSYVLLNDPRRVAEGWMADAVAPDGTEHRVVIAEREMRSGDLRAEIVGFVTREA